LFALLDVNGQKKVAFCFANEAFIYGTLCLQVIQVVLLSSLVTLIFYQNRDEKFIKLLQVNHQILYQLPAVELAVILT